MDIAIIVIIVSVSILYSFMGIAIFTSIVDDDRIGIAFLCSLFWLPVLLLYILPLEIINRIKYKAINIFNEETGLDKLSEGCVLLSNPKALETILTPERNFMFTILSNGKIILNQISIENGILKMVNVKVIKTNEVKYFKLISKSDYRKKLIDSLDE